MFRSKSRRRVRRKKHSLRQHSVRKDIVWASCASKPCRREFGQLCIRATPLLRNQLVFAAVKMDAMYTGLTLVALALLFGMYFVTVRASGEVANAKKRELGHFTAAQVAIHNHRDDLWVILRIKGQAKVFDVTSYVDEHPGGDAILTNAGGDSTEAFTGPQHPPRVYDMIDEFCIGDLVEE